MMTEKMLLNSDDCELLVAFELGGSIEKTGQLLGKDASGVSRQLLRISQICPAVEKQAGKWTLTQVGRSLSASIREFNRLQKQLASAKSVLRIGTNREFGSRLLGPNLESLSSRFQNSHISIMTFESGTEEALIHGKIDVSFDCERPIDPKIGFKHLLSDSIVAVCSPRFVKAHGLSLKSEKLFDLPHLLCDRLYPHRLIQNITEVRSAFSFNDIATARAACVAGNGWALLPKYSVQQELKNNLLVKVEEKMWSTTKYGIWWSRDRFTDPKTIKILSDWLGNIID